MRLSSLALVLVAACGGRYELANTTTDDGGTNPPDGDTPHSDGGTPDVTVPPDAVGSYDLVFATVTVAPDPPGGPQTTPPSKNHAFRLDVRKGADGVYQGVVTARWGQPGAFNVDVRPNQVRLSGKATYGAPFVSDTWETFTLADSTFTATGTETQSNGDVMYSSKITATGAVVKDTTVPELKVPAISSAGPANALLPWDPIYVNAAEPVHTGDLGAVKLSGLGVAWDESKPDPLVDWAGTVELIGRRTSFEPKGATAQIAIPASLGGDLVGLFTAALTQPLPFLDLPIVSKQHTFDGDVVTVGAWGDVKFLGGKAPDPACESGGCVELEFKAGYCNVPRMGFAARLDATGAKEIKVRYRVLVAGTSGAPTYLTQPFTMTAAIPGAPADSKAENVPITTVKALAAPILGYAYGTDWTSTTIAIPAASEAGVAVYAGTGPTGPDCGFVPAPVPVAVLVDVVNAQ